MSAALDLAFMREALALAARGRHSTSPNPAVGCVLVRDGAVVARGYHERAGAAHAEVRALCAAGAAARGATAYVSLEPCNHHGRTGPCTEALIEAGIARVVYACDDPNPQVAGQGAARLRAAGIDVTAGVAAAEAVVLNRGFFKRMRSGRPFVRIKLAMSLDARVALASGESQWITGPAARAEVQRLRAEACAVVTGSATVLADDPALTVRDPAFAMAGRQPRRVIVDRRLRTPPAARLFTLPGETRVLTESDDPERLAPLRASGAVVECFAPGALQPDTVLAHLAPLGVNEVLVEAGPTLAGAFLVARACDELVVHLAPKLLGLAARTAFEIQSPTRLSDAFGLDLVSSTPVGDDIALVFTPRSRSQE
ncbi:MAG: bifunctional diaminohydroxyphosphoribosylaminopyrimidine deaminase/5-amino-6-(5-phosphoribosylamino)uracil reductase RibD [Gammaproteobacteria bacterium]